MENLTRDFFLRRKMAADGTIPVTLIASFHRVRALTTELPVVLEAIRDSDKIELINGFLVTYFFYIKQFDQFFIFNANVYIY